MDQKNLGLQIHRARLFGGGHGVVVDDPVGKRKGDGRKAEAKKKLVHVVNLNKFM